MLRLLLEAVLSFLFLLSCHLPSVLIFAQSSSHATRCVALQSSSCFSPVPFIWGRKVTDLVKCLSHMHRSAWLGLICKVELEET
jgi:hypothetical protein